MKLSPHQIFIVAYDEHPEYVCDNREEANIIRKNFLFENKESSFKITWKVFSLKEYLEFCYKKAMSEGIDESFS